MTDDLLMLMDWLRAKKCTHTAMESTVPYWKPIYNLLELEEIEALVMNAQHIKNVPGRKTDVKDAEWIAGLLRHGLLKGSFIPNREQRELRELIRYRRSLIEERARKVRRIQKVLEGANIKLSSVASNVLGKSGRAMIEAMIAGETDPEALSDLTKRKLRNKKADLKRLEWFNGTSSKINAGQCWAPNSGTSIIWTKRLAGWMKKLRSACFLLRKTWNCLTQSQVWHEEQQRLF